MSQPGGMDTINAAILELQETVPREEWRTAAVAVAPSTVQVTLAVSSGVIWHIWKIQIQAREILCSRRPKLFKFTYLVMSSTNSLYCYLVPMVFTLHIKLGV